MARATKNQGLPKLPPAFVWPWFFVSFLLHGILALSFYGVISHSGRSGLLAGRGIEEGHGFGGGSVDFEIAGPEEEAPAGAMPAAQDATRGQPALAPEAPPIEEPTNELAAEDTTAREPAAREREPVEEPTPTVRSEVEAEERPGDDARDSMATDTTEAAAPGDQEAPAGSGADDSLSGAPAGDAAGLILGSVGAGGDLAGARRALLPNGGMCDDPAAGVWRAQRFDAGRRQWVRFTLRIRRDASGGLTGTIDNRSWSGSPRNASPGPCTAFGFDQTWRMRARGRYEDGQMTFEASSVRLYRVNCPDSTRTHTYFPDRFRGTVRPMQDRFDAVNNDGHLEFDRPYTFRRIACQ